MSFQCEICDRKLRTKSGLNTHMKACRKYNFHEIQAIEQKTVQEVPHEVLLKEPQQVEEKPVELKPEPKPEPREVPKVETVPSAPLEDNSSDEEFDYFNSTPNTILAVETPVLKHAKTVSLKQTRRKFWRKHF